ncbi:MAG: RidA family protein [Candidatus Latescibacteria bacterium]|nr:RidA family protein [Candidatus Latescibacterota bacterium]
MLVENERGHYAFLTGIAPYSSGAVALPGYEIVHAHFQIPVHWEKGFGRIIEHLKDEGQDRFALCGVELRCPEPYSMDGFIAFNEGYCAVLEELGLYMDDMNPVARTNVSPEIGAPGEPALYGFSYTVPAQGDVGKTFVAAGAGELNSPKLISEAIIRRGDLSLEAMHEKATYVMNVMEKRMTGLGGSWEVVTAADVYTVHPVIDVVEDVVLPKMGASAIHGVHWFHARPPIVEIEFEMDLRGVRKEVVL